MRTILKKINNKKSYMYLYVVALIILIANYTLDNSSILNYNDTFFHDFTLFISIGMLSICLFLKCLNKQITRISILFYIIGLLCYLSTRYTAFLLMIFAITLIPIENIGRIFRIVLIEKILLIFGIITASQLGIIPDLTLTISKQAYVVETHAMGYVHPNMLSADIISTLMLYIYINQYRMNAKRYIIYITISIIAYIITKTRTALFISLILLVFTILRDNRYVKKCLFMILPYMYMLTIFFITFLILAYGILGADNKLISIINDGIFNGRIGLAYMALTNYPISLFGNRIDFSIWNDWQYFALDNGQTLILLEYGIAGFTVYWMIYNRILKVFSKNKEYILGIIVALFIIWSIYEATMYFLGKNFIFLCFMMRIKEIGGIKNDTKSNPLLLVWKRRITRFSKKMHSKLEKVLSRI